ncbi:MAG: alanine--tRNA ligase, partial [bacterium]
MTSSEVRRQFIEFFESRQHTIVPSSPVVPADDPTLLFTNAGMNQFKDVFLGTGTRPYSRAVDSQKCIRVSGKHNDLEEVGLSPNHHTFFEMLGNWSFGDYYKAEAIRWAWELMTEVYGLEKSKLFATVFTEDDEAYKLWKSETDIDPSHVSKHNHKDNFWEMGETGPCGPCSEIHYDLGAPAPGRKEIENDGPNSGTGRFIELWNLVFIQYHRDENGKLHDLPAKHVDTGAGLERIVRALNGVDSNYETDLFKPLIDAIADASGVPYLPPSEGGKEKDYIPHRAIADHLRMLAFAIADGALPGNEGRGYVLRRVLRRAARFIRELVLEAPFLPSLVPLLIGIMGDHYSELKDRQQHIEAVLKAEEEAFARTLGTGLAEWRAMYVSQFARVISGKNKAALHRLMVTMQKSPVYTNDQYHSTFLSMESQLNELLLNDVAGFSLIESFDKNLRDLYSDLRLSNTDPQLYGQITDYISVKATLEISGSDAFKLYDTFGFPIDLTEQMARERGISVDVEGFYREMEAAKERSRAAGNFRVSGGEFTVVAEMEKHSVFTGYDSLHEATRIHLVRRIEGTGADGEKTEENDGEG